MGMKNITMQQFELLILRVKNEMPDASMEDRLTEVQSRLKALETAKRFV